MLPVSKEYWWCDIIQSIFHSKLYFHFNVKFNWNQKIERRWFILTHPPRITMDSCPCQYQYQRRHGIQFTQPIIIKKQPRIEEMLSKRKRKLLDKKLLFPCFCHMHTLPPRIWLSHIFSITNITYITNFHRWITYNCTENKQTNKQTNRKKTRKVFANTFLFQRKFAHVLMTYLHPDWGYRNPCKM